MASIQMTAMMQGNYTEVFRQKSFFKVELLRTDAFTQRSFYTQKLLHRGARTHRRDYNTAALTQRSLHTQKLLYRGAFTHRRVYTQKVLHTEAFTQAAFARRTLATEDLCNVDWRCKIAFSHQFFPAWPSFREKGLHLRFQNRNLTLDPNFVRKGDVVTHKNRISPRVVLPTRTIPAEGCAGLTKFAFCHRFVHPTRTISAEGCDRRSRICNSPHVCATRTILQGVTFCKPVFGCPCRLKKEFRKTSEVGVPQEFSDTSRSPRDLEVNYCVRTPV